MKNILFTLQYADGGYHGGTMYVAELGKYFNSLGYDVYCIALYTDKLTKSFFLENGVKLINFQESLPNVVYDIIWAHNFLLFPALLYKGLRYKKVVYSSLSSFLTVDTPPFFWDKFDKILVLSKENEDNFAQKYNIDRTKLKIFPNIVPSEYFTLQHKTEQKIKNVAIVSNYAPKELLELPCLLKKYNINCEIYGCNYKFVPITPEELNKYDVIISIGKTVQYALALGIPMYCYGRFGGCGYITPKNIDNEEYYNFSGRATNRKISAEEIVQEILDGYQEVLYCRHELVDLSHERYEIHNQVLKVVEELETLPRKGMEFSKGENMLLEQYYFLAEEMSRFWLNYTSKNKVAYSHVVINILGIKIKIKLNSNNHFCKIIVS